MVAYAHSDFDSNSPTVPFSATTSGVVYIVYGRSHTSTSTSTTPVTDDPWRTETHSNVTYITVAQEPKVDWVEFRREQRRAASMVPSPRENRAKERRHLKERKGFQQMCRLPCYRGVRTR